MSGKRGRPVHAGEIFEVHVHLRLRTGEDDDLIAFLNGIPPRRRAATLKVALRAGGMKVFSQAEGLPDDDLANALGDLLL